MSLFKLAAYGAIGYLVYQTFFAEMPASGRSAGARRGSAQRSGGQSRQGPRRAAARSSPMTGGGEGAEVSTQDTGGMSARHRVGRGVVS